MKPLTVYKASAGSGKTFTLAVEYIKLLIKDPECFKNILAVTFTNKATEEMKIRILSQLYGIWKMLPDSDNYTDTITKDLGISKERAAVQAGIALNNLIHNYSRFRIETIDSFFQSILRELARELDLTANLKISLSDTEIEGQAVDLLIETLDAKSVVLNWIISYIFSNIDEDKSWNVIKQVKEFGKTIFKDFYKTINDDLHEIISEKNFFDKYTEQLKLIRENTGKRMCGYAEMFEAETRNAGLSIFSYSGKKNGISSYFKKLRGKDFSDEKCKNPTLEKHLADSENWVSKNSLDKDVILPLVNDRLMSLLHEAEKERPRQWMLHKTADVTLRHLSELRLLNSIEKKIRELNEEANRFLLSDTQYLLQSLIKSNDSPFIFEKIGCQLEHIMIDEFQDTGSVQWQNFKVLLKECMSHNYGTDDSTVQNLIVGDVKQSIYRWRSGDWRLLNNIENQFDFLENDIEIRSLQKNYRSERNIIEFNNTFFTIASKYEYECELAVNTNKAAGELLRAYRDVCQSIREEKSGGGFVRISLLDEKCYNENMLTCMENNIDELLKSGVPLNKIAILTRKNKHIPVIADYFMKKRPDIRIVSDEAFGLDASLAVKTIIQALCLLTNPYDVLSKASLAVTYQKIILNRQSISDSDILTGFAKNNRHLDGMLPEAFIRNVSTLLEKPLFDVIEDIYFMFGLCKLENQSAYICAFYDAVSEFARNNSGNIRTFIDEWNESIHKKTIQSDEIDGIRLISIHKSKGLEFDNVIIPFCDWTLENKNTTLWCSPKISPFNSLPVVPVDYSKKLLETIYADDYRNEHIQNSVDNLNLLYVAFTRASHTLFVYGKYGKKNDSKGGGNNRSDVLQYSLPELHDKLKNSRLSENGQSVIFEYGNLCEKVNGSGNLLSDNVFFHHVEPYNIKIQTFNVPVKFKQSNKSRDFIENKDISEEQNRYIKIGNILHKLFSMIHTVSDIDRVLRQFEFDGILYDNDITVEKMRGLLLKRLSDRRIADWFDLRWRVFNECSIIYFDKEKNKTVECRPDRVITDGNEVKVIDFKFGKYREEYKSQVKGYMDILKSMGYRNITGYLWFVYSNNIEEIK